MTLAWFTRFRSVFVASCLWLVLAIPGFAGGFSSTLSAADKTAAGLDSLSDDDWDAIDKLVADDLAYARREKISAFGTAFSDRRNETARKTAGLDKLTEPQLAKLNELVAAVIARPAPRERPRLKESDLLAARKRGEIHGSVTLAYGWGGGREYRAGSLWLDYYDPETRFGLGIGITSVQGDGFYSYYPGYYPGRYFGNTYSAGYYDGDFAAAPFLSASYRGEARPSFVTNDADCFRGMPAGGFGGRGGGRRR